MPGTEPAKQARGTDLKQAIHIGLDETFTALLEAFAGLPDPDFHAWRSRQRHSLVVLVEHCIQGLDLWACEVQGFDITFPAEARFDIMRKTPEQVQAGLTGEALPTVATEQTRVAALRDNVLQHLDTMPAEQLTQPNGDCWWFEENPDRTRADAYMRAITHNNAHVRQIWALRGAMSLAPEGAAWPRQHWA